MSFHLIIGDKLHSSWSLRGALVLDLAGVGYTEQLIKLGHSAALGNGQSTVAQDRTRHHC